MIGCAAVSAVTGGYLLLRGRGRRTGPIDRADRATWRMPPLTMLSAPVMSAGRKMGLTALRAYLAIAMILVIIKITQIALGH